MSRGFAATVGKRVNAGESDMLYVPTTPRGVGVMLCHGAGGVYSDWQRAAGTYCQLPQRLAYAGYHVLAGDWGGQQTWGNDVLLARLEAGRALLMGLGCQSKVVLVGASMGNLNIFRFMADHPDQVVCGVGLIPATNIEDLRARNVLGIKALAEAAWGIGPTDPIPARGVPMNRVADMTSVPWAAWYGAADTVVKASDTVAIAAALGPDSMAVQTDAAIDHGDNLVAKTPWADVLDWVHARVHTNS